MKYITSAACVLVAILGLAFTGCGFKASKELLIGEWEGSAKIDEAAYKKEMKARMPDRSDEDIAKELEFAKGVKLLMTFKDDGTLVMASKSSEPDREPITGKWTFVSAEGTTLKLKIVPDKNRAPTEEPPVALNFISRNEFGMQPPGNSKGMRFILRRK